MRYLPLLLILTACQGATAPMTDAGADHADAHMLRFDAGANTDTDTSAPDVGSDTAVAADAGFDAGADAIIQTDAPWWLPTDVGPQCDGGAVDCGASTMCGVCLANCFNGTMPPDYCYTLAEWQYVKHCLMPFTCVP